MPDVYVRLREAGLEDGEPIPADGTVTLSPIHVVDPDAWVTAAATVLHVRDGEAAPASVSAGRWRVAARSRSWERSWVLDLEDGDTPVNLVSLTPVDPSTPLPWAPTLADLEEIRETRDSIPQLVEDAIAEQGGGGLPREEVAELVQDGILQTVRFPYSSGTGLVVIPPQTSLARLPLNWWSSNPLAEMQGRAITSLDIVHGKLYSGFGDWGANGDHVGVVSHDFETGESTIEYEGVESEAVEKVIGRKSDAGGDVLYVPHIDGNQNFWAGCGYSVCFAGEWSEVRLPGQALHVFDMAYTDVGIWAVGSRILPDQKAVAPAVWYGKWGEPWEVFYDEPVPEGTWSNDRFYWIATDGEKVRVQAQGPNVAPRKLLELSPDGSVATLPPISEHSRQEYVDGEWVTLGSYEKIVEGVATGRPPGVYGKAWAVHDGYYYYASGRGGIKREVYEP